MRPRVLVACVGNIFLGDDGFGVEVARRLAGERFPEWVRVEDFGIRGVHLAYELLEGYDLLVLVDASPRGEPPGTVYVIEPDLGAAVRPDGVPPVRPLVDAHDMEPDSVLALLETLGGKTGRVVVVGCEPEAVEDGIGLSEPVSRAVDRAVDVVRDLIDEEIKEAAASTGAGPARAAADKGGVE